MYCAFAAGLIDLPPVIPIDRIAGEGLPESALEQFRSIPDEFGNVDWLEVSTCPLSSVDQLSPRYGPGWLADVYESASGIAADLPAHWLEPNPSPLLSNAVVTLKGVVDAAQYFKSENSEDW